MATQRDVEAPNREQIEVAAATMKLLADPTRLRIVWALLHGEHSVNELADHVGANPPGVSQHLAKLRLSRLVRSRRDGNRIFYSVENAHLASLVQQALFHADHVVQGLADHASAAKAPRGKRHASAR